MSNTIKIKFSNTAAAAPASLVDGEMAINQADNKLYYRDSAGNVKSKTLLSEAGGGGAAAEYAAFDTTTTNKTIPTGNYKLAVDVYSITGTVALTLAGTALLKII